MKYTFYYKSLLELYSKNEFKKSFKLININNLFEVFFYLFKIISFAKLSL